MIFTIGTTLALLSWFVGRFAICADIDLSERQLAALVLTFIFGVVLALGSLLTLAWGFLP